MTDITQIKEALIKCGISPSRPRVAILGYLRKHYTHPTADEIFRDLRGSVPTLSLTTVYNTLKLFSEKGLCLSLTINEKQVCYDGQTFPHGHLLCNKCGKIHDIVQEIVSPVPVEDYINGHCIKEVHYYYKGICSECLTN
jgi:Fe2+ or Zn2+ uptake regulation protein